MAALLVVEANFPRVRFNLEGTEQVAQFLPPPLAISVEQGTVKVPD